MTWAEETCSSPPPISQLGASTIEMDLVCGASWCMAPLPSLLPGTSHTEIWTLQSIYRLWLRMDFSPWKTLLLDQGCVASCGQGLNCWYNDSGKQRTESPSCISPPTNHCISSYCFRLYHCVCPLSSMSQSNKQVFY